MIARVVEDEELATEAVALATRLAQGPTVAYGLLRQPRPRRRAGAA